MPLTANGPLKVLLIILALGALGIVGATFWPPFAAKYEVQSAAKTACNQLTMQKKYEMNGGGKVNWELPFVKRCQTAGVRLKPEQYAFDVKLGNKTNPHVCTVNVRWRSTTTWFFISDYFDLPPIVQLQNLEFEHKVKTTY